MSMITLISSTRWSIGVIVYILLSGYPPFYGDTMQEVLKHIQSGKYKFIRPYFDLVTDKAKDFVSKLLEYNASKVPLSSSVI